MCGIFGYIGDKDPLKTSLHALQRLEYRGYDSSGIAGVCEGKILFWKKAGKLANLKQELSLSPLQPLDLAIGHTRWATHGKVTDQNAHPHFDETGSIAVVHNGIIENYEALRAPFLKSGIRFSSETDTEIIAALIASHYKGDLLEAVQKTLPLLEGIYALAIIHKSHPDQIIAAANKCPLAVGFNDEKTEAIVASDPNAFLGSLFNVLFLQNGEMADLRKGSLSIYHLNKKKTDKKIERLQADSKPPSKEGFEHFMLKEIHEQPNTIQKAFLGRIHEGQVVFDSLSIKEEEFKNYKKIWFLGCGTSAHAGSIGSIYMEELAKIPACCDIASEGRYRTSLLEPETLVIAISQSGETADTLAALREAKKKGCKILSICNVKNSTIVRESDGFIDLKAGPEMSVCSTKAFSSQVAVLLLFALYLARLKRTMSAKETKRFLEELAKVPSQLEQVLHQEKKIKELAKKYASYNNFFFLGRRYMYITSLEAALKLKEISYVNANGYPAGELKHGPIALLDANFPVIAFCANHLTEEKIASSLMEAKARGAPILAFASQEMKNLQTAADDTFYLPSTLDELAPFASTVAGQLFAYWIAKERDCDIDQPRNLAKSVTVE